MIELLPAELQALQKNAEILKYLDVKGPDQYKNTLLIEAERCLFDNDYKGAILKYRDYIRKVCESLKTGEADTMQLVTLKEALDKIIFIDSLMEPQTAGLNLAFSVITELKNTMRDIITSLPALSIVNLSLAMQSIREKDFKKARKIINSEISQLNSESPAIIKLYEHMANAALFKAEDNINESISAYRNSLELLESCRLKLNNQRYTDLYLEIKTELMALYQKQQDTDAEKVIADLRNDISTTMTNFWANNEFAYDDPDIYRMFLYYSLRAELPIIFNNANKVFAIIKAFDVMGEKSIAAKYASTVFKLQRSEEKRPVKNFSMSQYQASFCGDLGAKYGNVDLALKFYISQLGVGAIYNCDLTAIQDKLLSIYNKDPHAFNYLISVQRERSDYDFYGMIGIAAFYIQVKNYEKTESVLQALMLRYPEHYHIARAQSLLATVYAATNQNDKAISLLEALLKNKSGDERMQCRHQMYQLACLYTSATNSPEYIKAHIKRAVELLTEAYANGISNYFETAMALSKLEELHYSGYPEATMAYVETYLTGFMQDPAIGISVLAEAAKKAQSHWFNPALARLRQLATLKHNPDMNNDTFLAREAAIALGEILINAGGRANILEAVDVYGMLGYIHASVNEPALLPLAIEYYQKSALLQAETQTTYMVYNFSKLGRNRKAAWKAINAVSGLQNLAANSDRKISEMATMALIPVYEAQQKFDLANRELQKYAAEPYNNAYAIYKLAKAAADKGQIENAKSQYLRLLNNPELMSGQPGNVRIEILDGLRDFIKNSIPSHVFEMLEKNIISVISRELIMFPEVLIETGSTYDQYETALIGATDLKTGVDLKLQPRVFVKNSTLHNLILFLIKNNGDIDSFPGFNDPNTGAKWINPCIDRDGKTFEKDLASQHKINGIDYCEDRTLKSLMEDCFTLQSRRRKNSKPI